MLTREERLGQIVALEEHLIGELEPALAGRVRKLYKALDRLMGLRELGKDTERTLGWRLQTYFVNHDAELIEEGMINIYRYARPRSLNAVLRLLETRGMSVTVLPNKRRGPIPVWRALHTPRGKIIF